MGTGSFPGVTRGRGVLLTTHPLLVPRSWKSRAILLHNLWATPDLQRNHLTFFTCIFWRCGSAFEVCMYKHDCTQFPAKTYTVLSLQILAGSFWKTLTETRYQTYSFVYKFPLKKKSRNFIIPPKACVYLPCLMQHTQEHLPRILRH